MDKAIHYLDPNPELAAQVDGGWFDATYSGTLFHGTGRFHLGYDDGDKSKPNGKLVDIFAAVANQGLQPRADHISKLLFEAERTISLTRERIYARYYAELFGKDDLGNNSLQYTFGDAEDWREYYFSITRKATLSRRNAHYLPAFLKHLATRFNGTDLRRIKDVDFHRARWLMNRAAVAGNYPVIFGVNKKDVTLLPMPYGLGFFEDRTGDPIGPERIKLVEVPIASIAETRLALSKLGLDWVAVVPMELAEVYSFRRGLRACMDCQFK